MNVLSTSIIVLTTVQTPLDPIHVAAGLGIHCLLMDTPVKVYIIYLRSKYFMLN